MKEVKESNKRRIDEKVKSIDKDGLKISTSHSTQTFYQAYYFSPLSLGARYVLSLFHHVIQQQQLSIKQQNSSSRSVGDGRVDSNTKKSSNCAAAAAKDTEDVESQSEEAK